MFKIVFYFLLVGADSVKLESPQQYNSYAECIVGMLNSAPYAASGISAPIQSMYGTCELAEGSL